MSNNWEIIGVVISSFSFSLAFYIYLKQRQDNILQVLTLIKKQIESIGPWVASNTHGYGNTLTEKQKFDNSDPYKLIFEIENASLTQISSLPGINDIPEEVVGKINELNQDINRIKSIQNVRNLIVTNNTDTSLSITKELNKYKAKHGTNNFSQFTNSLTSKEKDLVNIFRSYGHIIHCEIIGNTSHGMRNHWELIKNWNEEELYKNKKFLSNDLLTMILLSFLLLPGVLGFLVIYNHSTYKLPILQTSIVIAVILSLLMFRNIKKFP